MKNFSIHSFLILAMVTSTSSHIDASQPISFKGSPRYNLIHTATTAGSFAVAGVLVPATQFLFGLALGFGGMPQWLTKSPFLAGAIFGAMKYSGLAAGACLVGATPYLTDRALCKYGYLSKKEATYTRNELLIHGGIRLLALALMYQYGTKGTNAIKSIIFKMRNG